MPVKLDVVSHVTENRPREQHGWHIVDMGQFDHDLKLSRYRRPPGGDFEVDFITKSNHTAISERSNPLNRDIHCVVGWYTLERRKRISLDFTVHLVLYLFLIQIAWKFNKVINGFDIIFNNVSIYWSFYFRNFVFTPFELHGHACIFIFVFFVIATLL